MTSAGRIIRIAAIVLAVVIIAVVIAAILVIRSTWFKGYVKQTLVSSLEATGGRVEMRSFSFEPSHLRIVATDLVIRGNEPAGAPPFVRAARMEMLLRPFGWMQAVHIRYLALDRPEVNITVFPDGRTNLPTPPRKAANRPPLESFTKLEISHLVAANGLVVFRDEERRLNARGENLNAQLGYSLTRGAYQGEVTASPVHVAADDSPPSQFQVTLPVTVGADSVAFAGARISSSVSNLLLNCSIANLRHPDVSANVSGRVGAADIQALGLPFSNDSATSMPGIQVDAAIAAGANKLQIEKFEAVAGESLVKASGSINEGGIRFSAHVDLDQLSAWLNIPNRPAGLIDASGTATSPPGVRYEINGNLIGKDISFQEGRQRVSNINLVSQLHAQPGQVGLNDLRMKAFQGVFTGSAVLRHFRFYTLTGRVTHLDLNTAMRALGQKNLAYKGFVSGPLTIEGDLKAHGASGVQVRGQLTITPSKAARLPWPAWQPNAGPTAVVSSAWTGVNGLVERISGPHISEDGPQQPGTGETQYETAAAKPQMHAAPIALTVPLSPLLRIEYDGATNTLTVNDTQVALPKTTITLNGTLGSRLRISLKAASLDELVAGLPVNLKPPVSVRGGAASFNGVLAGRLASPRLTGHFEVRDLEVQGVRFDLLSAEIDVSSKRANITGKLTRASMQMTFSAMAGLRNWKIIATSPISLTAAVRSGDLSDFAALVGLPRSEIAGVVDADLRVRGTFGNPQGSGTLTARNTTIYGESFNTIQAQLNASSQVLNARATLAGPGGQVVLAADYRHPANSFATGTLRASVQTAALSLEQSRVLQQHLAGAAGVLQLNADVRGNIVAAKRAGRARQDFQLLAVNADLAARGLRVAGQNYGDLTARVRTTGQTVTFNVSSNFGGATIRADGATQLVRGYPTTINAQVTNLQLEPALAVLHHLEIPATGTVSASVQLAGNLEDLANTARAQADVSLTDGSLYGQPYNRLHAQVNYLPQSIDVPLIEGVSPAGQVEASARYNHAPGNLRTGQLEFRVNASNLDLARIQKAQELRPGLAGKLQLSANGSVALRQGQLPVFHTLNASVAAQQITSDGKPLGDLTLTATTAGQQLDFKLDSDLAGASIHGAGTVRLAGNYPLNANVDFTNLTWKGLAPLVDSPATIPPDFTALADGRITLTGPAANVREWQGTLRVTRLEAGSVPPPGTRRTPFLIQNQGDIVATLNRGVLTIDALHLLGPHTDITARGTVAVPGGNLDLTVDANANLQVLESLNRDLHARGNVIFAGNILGTLRRPLINGRLDLQHATVTSVQFPNGISNANGTVTFSGNSATVRNLTAESGGGKITINGFAIYSGVFRFYVRAQAAGVRVWVQQGVSVVVSGNVNLAGSTQASLLTGSISIDEIDYLPTSDLASILTRVAPPIQAPVAPSPLLENMKLDVRVGSGLPTAVRATLAQNVQATIDLHVRGTAAQPGVLGQITMNEGKITFFGYSYKIQSGTIGFFNPVRIEPVLNVALETKVRAVDVVVRVSGPIENLKLTYTSDPPLQFQEIVNLLASGQSPTTNATLLAQQPTQPMMDYQQMGESVLLSQALVNPLANRLQRVFGVSQLRIEPAFITGQETPIARLTIEEQITPSILFTYATPLNYTNYQIVSVEWAFKREWSAVGKRDEFGIVTITLFYKRQFR